MASINDLMSDGPMQSARKFHAVTPSNTVDLPSPTKALYVGGAGTVSIQGIGDSTPVTFNVPAGIVLPVRVTRVFATGTTATGIVGLM